MVQTKINSCIHIYIYDIYINTIMDIRDESSKGKAAKQHSKSWKISSGVTLGVRMNNHPLNTSR